MRRILFIVCLLVLVACSVPILAHAVRYQEMTWDFQRADGPTITVIIDSAGDMVVLEGGVFVGHRPNTCTVLD